MNNNIQIRIWANYKDFAEATEKVPLRILPDNYREIFSPDRYREIICENYHSFLYTQDAICINFHTLVPSTQRLRDQRIVITLAVRRGYQLEQDPAELLSAIRRDFLAFINDKSLFFEPDNVNGIEDKIISKIEEWEDAISVTIEDEQLRINRSNDTKGTALVAYKNSDDFDAYVKKPARPEYKGFRLVFIVPDESKMAFGRYEMKELSVSPIYTPSYSVYLPAYDPNIPIATIHSLGDVINVRKEKKYHKPLELNGSLQDNWLLWKVSRTADGEGYNLGITFDADSKVYKLDFDKLSDPFSKFSFGWGKLGIVPSPSLILTGDELGKTIDKNLVNSRSEQYVVKDVQCKGDTIAISWIERFQYNIPNVRDYIYRKYKFTPSITIINNGSKQTEKKWWDGSPKDYTLVITDESGTYEKKQCSMETPLSDIKLEKKSGIKIKFFWRDNIKVDTEHPISFTIPNDNQRIERKAELLGEEVEFFSTGSYTISLKGYKPIDESLRVRKESDGTIEYLRFKPTFKTRIKANVIPIVMIILLIMGSILGGYFIRIYFPNLPPKVEIVNNDNVREHPIVQTYVKQQLDSLEHENQQRMSDIEKEYEGIITLLENKLKNYENGAATKLSKAMKKLRSGISYTQNDIDEAKKLAQPNSPEMSICNACEKALKFCGGERDKKKIALLDNFVKGEEFSKLPQKSQEALKKIVNNEKYRNAYGATKSCGSIDKLLKEIKNQIG